MPIPFVIDHENTKHADALNESLADPLTTSLDVASAYFAVSGYRLVGEALQGLKSFRLLLGATPEAAQDLGLRPHAQRAAGSPGRRYRRLRRRGSDCARAMGDIGASFRDHQ